jgi:hypothetical protein
MDTMDRVVEKRAESHGRLTSESMLPLRCGNGRSVHERSSREDNPERYCVLKLDLPHPTSLIPQPRAVRKRHCVDNIS